MLLFMSDGGKALQYSLYIAYTDVACCYNQTLLSVFMQEFLLPQRKLYQ